MKKWINMDEFFDEVGGMSRFVGRFFREGFSPRYEFSELIRQCYSVGYKSLPLVGITAFIMGLVLTIQSRPTLVKFGAESMLPLMVSVSLVREISPVDSTQSADRISRYAAQLASDTKSKLVARFSLLI